jgi:hypothetical protein
MKPSSDDVTAQRSKFVSNERVPMSEKKGQVGDKISPRGYDGEKLTGMPEGGTDGSGNLYGIGSGAGALSNPDSAKFGLPGEDGTLPHPGV